MSTEQKPRISHPPLPDGRPETWVYLADWPMPEDGKRAVEVELKWHRFRGKALTYLEEGIKLTYLFGGLWTVLNAAADSTSDGLHAWLFSLPAEQSERILIHYVEGPYEEREMRI
jgi:hypothetical protein